MFNIKFLPYSDTTSILLVGIGSQIASVHWHFLERFSELNYHFFSKSKGKILHDFAFLLHFEIVWLLSQFCVSFTFWNSLVIVTITSSMFTVLPAILFYQIIRYKFPKYGLVFMWHAVAKKKFGKDVLHIQRSNHDYLIWILPGWILSKTQKAKSSKNTLKVFFKV